MKNKEQKHKNVTANKVRRSKVLIVLGILMLLVFIYVVISQVFAHTPKITDEEGNVVEGSIAELNAVTINGKKEWLSIRGYNKSAPVILFLAGGPGGTQLAATRINLNELEKEFVIVNWDQPGSGKSFHSMNYKDISIETYIEDGVAVTEYLLRKFGKNKIYLIGESWGSALAIMLAKEKPQYYEGLIGTGQMVDFEESEIIDYYKAIDILEASGDTEKVEKLKKQGAPWYETGNITMKSSAYLGVLSDAMAMNPDITNSGYNTFSEMFGDEYGIRDSVDYLLSLYFTFGSVYPKLKNVDLRETHTKLEVPVYLFEGAHDINAPIELAKDYFEKLACPKKEWVTFEHSGHSPWKNESSKFIEETIRVFLNREN